MQKNKWHVLSTRPLSKKLTDEAASNNILLSEVSFIDTMPLNDEVLQHKIANYLRKDIVAVFTSMNGVAAVTRYIEHNPRWKIYCIGNTTKTLVSQSFGEDSIAGYANDARHLAELIINDDIKNAVFFCGDKRREDLPSLLKEHNILIEELVVYSTIETPVHINGKYDGILFFSPSAVESFFSMNHADNHTQLFAIGSTTASAIQQYVQSDVIVSASPGKEFLVKQMIDHFCR